MRGARQTNVATNTGLTRELAVGLPKKREVLCPNCGKSMLVSRYAHKSKTSSTNALCARRSTTLASSFDLHVRA